MHAGVPQLAPVPRPVQPTSACPVRHARARGPAAARARTPTMRARHAWQTLRCQRPPQLRRHVTPSVETASSRTRMHTVSHAHKYSPAASTWLAEVDLLRSSWAVSSSRMAFVELFRRSSQRANSSCAHPRAHVRTNAHVQCTQRALCASFTAARDCAMVTSLACDPARASSRTLATSPCVRAVSSPVHTRCEEHTQVPAH